MISEKVYEQNKIVQDKTSCRTMKERLEYIDISKGLLIICVVLGHVGSICREFGGIDNNYFNHSGWLLAMFYIPFYMQAFFFITGYTSNFNKPFGVFLKQNIQRILLPYVSFGVLYAAFNKLLFDKDFFFTTMDGEQLFFLVEYYWFLSSMFIAKVLYWLLNRMFNRRFALMLCFVSLLLGIAISIYYKGLTGTAHWHNFFHYRNALMMLVFIASGSWLKNCPPHERKKIITIGGIVYSFLFIIFQVMNIHIPSDGHGTSLPIEDVPMHLLFATTGTFFVMLVSKKIEEINRIISAFLQKFGRYSLTVYTIHYMILEAIAAAVGYFYQPEGKIEGIVSYFSIAAITLFCCYLAIHLFNKKPLRYILGDF